MKVRQWKEEGVCWMDCCYLTWLILYYLMLANWKNFHWNSCSNLFAESVPKYMRYWKYLCCLKLDHAKYLFYANTRRNYHSFRNWNLLAASRWTNKFVFTKVISERTSQIILAIKSFTNGATPELLRAVKLHIVKRNYLDWPSSIWL